MIFTIVYFQQQGVASDGTEFVKSWVLNWDKVAPSKMVCLTKTHASKTSF